MTQPEKIHALPQFRVTMAVSSITLSHVCGVMVGPPSALSQYSVSVRGQASRMVQVLGAALRAGGAETQYKQLN